MKNDVPARCEAILNLLEKGPLTVNEIADGIDDSYSAVAYAISKLRGKLQRKQVNRDGRLCHAYSLKEAPQPAPLADRVVEYLTTHPWSTASEVYMGLSATPADKVWSCLQEMVDSGTVIRVRPPHTGMCTYAVAPVKPTPTLGLKSAWVSFTPTIAIPPQTPPLERVLNAALKLAADGDVGDFERGQALKLAAALAVEIAKGDA